MLDTWPFVSQEYFHGKKVSQNSLTILYFPLTGGEFLAKILSCCDEFYGETYFDFLNAYYKPSTNDWLQTYENGHHENIFPAHARYYTFDEWFKFKNVIYINYTLSEIETNWLKLRKTFIKNSVYELPYSDLQLKYEKELINFFTVNGKKYFDFPLITFLDPSNFANKVNELLSYYSLSKLDKNKVKKIWKEWMNLNIKKAKEK